MRDDVINYLAGRYGIEIVWYDRMDDIPKKFAGPAGQGCDVINRRLHFHNNNYVSIEHYFHELVHVVTQPPWWSIKKTPEEFVLFQFERAVAKSLFDEYSYDKVIDWQVETAIVVGEGRSTQYGYIQECLFDIPEYTKKPFWKLGLDVCHAVGLLNSRNKPTFEWPNWSKIDHCKDAIYEYIYSHAKTPLPKVSP